MTAQDKPSDESTCAVCGNPDILAPFVRLWSKSIDVMNKACVIADREGSQKAIEHIAAFLSHSDALDDDDERSTPDITDSAVSP